MPPGIVDSILIDATWLPTYRLECARRPSGGRSRLRCAPRSHPSPFSDLAREASPRPTTGIGSFAVFILLHRATGEVMYVNAGHHPPMIAGSEPVQLEATGVPLGLFPNATYEARTAALPPGGTLLVYTDGLTDSIAEEAPERQVHEAMAGTPAETLERLTKLIQPKLAMDDVTLVVVRRAG
jgi:Stage II sporulation protein E (SpoIIE)